MLYEKDCIFVRFIFMLTGCGNKVQQVQWSSISQDELDKLMVSTESVNDTVGT